MMHPIASNYVSSFSLSDTSFSFYQVPITAMLRETAWKESFSQVLHIVTHSTHWYWWCWFYHYSFSRVLKNTAQNCLVFFPCSCWGRQTADMWVRAAKYHITSSFTRLHHMQFQRQTAISNNFNLSVQFKGWTIYAATSPLHLDSR